MPRILSLLLLAFFIGVPTLVYAQPEPVLISEPIVVAEDVLEFGSEVRITDPVTRDLISAGGQVSVAAPIAQDGIIAGGSITISEAVTGNLIIFGGTAHITAPIAGDVFAVGGTIILSAPVSGDVRIFGGSILLEENINGNVALAGGEVTLAQSGSVAGSFVANGGSLTLNGPITGSVVIRTQKAAITSHIGGDVRAMIVQSDGLVIAETASIVGNFTYTSPKENTKLNTASIGGEVSYSPLPIVREQKNAMHWFFRIVSLFGMLVVGLVLVTLAPKTLRAGVVSSIARPLPDVAWGAGSLVLVPMSAFVLFVTIIGIPFSVMLLVMYGVSLYIAQIVTGAIMGMYVFGFFQGKKDAKNGSLLAKTIVGTVVLWLITGIPEIGWAISLIATIWGLGIIIRMIRRVFETVEGK